MLDFLETIGDAIIGLFQLITAMFVNVIKVAQLVGQGFAFAFQAIAFMPVQYQVILIACISFCVIVTILHFGG